MISVESLKIVKCIAPCPTFQDIFKYRFNKGVEKSLDVEVQWMLIRNVDLRRMDPELRYDKNGITWHVSIKAVR